MLDVFEWSIGSSWTQKLDNPYCHCTHKKHEHQKNPFIYHYIYKIGQHFISIVKWTTSLWALEPLHHWHLLHLSIIIELSLLQVEAILSIKTMLSTNQIATIFQYQILSHKNTVTTNLPISKICMIFVAYILSQIICQLNRENQQ